jgi:hypothetical protein
MGLGQAGDARFPLGERAVMQALAQHVGLPFVDLDPLKIDAKLAPSFSPAPSRVGTARSSSRPTSGT